MILSRSQSPPRVLLLGMEKVMSSSKSCPFDELEPVSLLFADDIVVGQPWRHIRDDRGWWWWLGLDWRTRICLLKNLTYLVASSSMEAVSIFVPPGTSLWRIRILSLILSLLWRAATLCGSLLIHMFFLFGFRIVAGSMSTGCMAAILYIISFIAPNSSSSSSSPPWWSCGCCSSCTCARWSWLSRSCTTMLKQEELEWIDELTHRESIAKGSSSWRWRSRRDSWMMSQSWLSLSMAMPSWM